MRIVFLRGCLIFSLFACGGAELDDGEDNGNHLTTPSGLILTQEEHEAGWGLADCTMCHNLENIHLENRTGLPIDIVATHDLAISEGISGCAACHGPNGL
jgi:hypothetical protein